MAQAVPPPAQSAENEASSDKVRIYKPLLSRAFEGTTVDISPACPSARRAGLEEVLGLMGYDKSSGGSSCNKYFVTDSALSEGCYDAVISGKKPVKYSWIFDSFRAMEKLPLTADYVVKPFEKCVICVTGFAVVSRQIIQQIVVSMGGVFSPEFSKKCTHLIAQVTYAFNRSTKNTIYFHYTFYRVWQVPNTRLLSAGEYLQ